MKYVPKDSTLHKQTKYKDNEINEVRETSTSLEKIIQKVEKVESTLLPTKIEKKRNKQNIKQQINRNNK